MRLPDLEDVEVVASNRSAAVNDSLNNTEKILQRLLTNIEAFRLIESDNKALRNMLLSNQKYIKKDFEEKLLRLMNKVKDKQEYDDLRHKSLLKKHESIKLELNKELSVEKKKNDFLKHKYHELLTATDKLLSDNKELQNINKTILKKIEVLENKSLANDKLLDDRTQDIKHDFNEKLANIVKMQVKKEIEYKTRVDSLTHDLKKYYDELRITKQKYYKREDELRKKIKDLID